jgi:nitrogen regulatory protein P-II 1
MLFNLFSKNANFIRFLISLPFILRSGFSRYNNLKVLYYDNNVILQYYVIFLICLKIFENLIFFIYLCENMKRIEAIVHVDKMWDLNEKLKEIGLKGCTIIDGKGRGKGEKPVLGSGRGTEKYTSEFSARSNISTVVDDSEVDKVVKTILEAASTGSPGDGKIFISTVAEAIDIGTQKRGNEALK